MRAYLLCRQKECCQFEEVSPDCYEALLKHPLPRAVAPLVPWLDAIEIKIMVQVNRDHQTLMCVMLTETSKTHFTINSTADGLATSNAHCVVDTKTWNPLVTGLMPNIAKTKFFQRRKSERKLAASRNISSMHPPTTDVRGPPKFNVHVTC